MLVNPCLVLSCQTTLIFLSQFSVCLLRMFLYERLSSYHLSRYVMEFDYFLLNQQLETVGHFPLCDHHASWFYGLKGHPCPSGHLIQLLHDPTWVGVVMVKSSMNPLIASYWTPEAIPGPLASFPAVGTIRFIPMRNNIGETVHADTMPFSMGCHPVVKSMVQNCNLMSLK